jgi:hypothetical protein
MPPPDVLPDVAPNWLTPDQQATLLLGLADKVWQWTSIDQSLHPSVGDLVFVKAVPSNTPAIERVGRLAALWSYIPYKDEVYMLALLNGQYIKWSNVPVQLDT